jgi:hypothetical protein
VIKGRKENLVQGIRQQETASKSLVMTDSTWPSTCNPLSKSMPYLSCFELCVSERGQVMSSPSPSKPGSHDYGRSTECTKSQ